MPQELNNERFSERLQAYNSISEYKTDQKKIDIEAKQLLVIVQHREPGP